MTLNKKIKEVLIKEVGEASKRPFRYKREENSYDPKEKDSFTYEFKTKNNFLYSISLERVYGRIPFGSETLTKKDWKEELAYIYALDRKMYVNLRNLGIKKDDLKYVWIISFAAEPIDSKNYNELFDAEGDLRRDIYPTVSGGTVIVPQMIYRREGSGYNSGIDDTNQGDFYKVMATISKIIKNHVEKHGGKILTFSPVDERRGRVFSRFIIKQMPGTKVWVNSNEFYFILKK